MRGPLSVAVVLACALTAGPAGAAGEVIERVLAVVGGEVILLSDLVAARELGLVSGAPDADPVAAILPLLIDRLLILGEVQRYAPPEPDESAVEAALQSVRARFADRARFDAVLARAGLDERRLRERLRQDLRIEAYLTQRFSGGPPDATGDPERRRQRLVQEWLAGLRRRATITDLSQLSEQRR